MSFPAHGCKLSLPTAAYQRHSQLLSIFKVAPASSNDDLTSIMVACAGVRWRMDEAVSTTVTERQIQVLMTVILRLCTAWLLGTQPCMPPYVMQITPSNGA